MEQSKSAGPRFKGAALQRPKSRDLLLHTSFDLLKDLCLSICYFHYHSLESHGYSGQSCQGPSQSMTSGLFSTSNPQLIRFIYEILGVILGRNSICKQISERSKHRKDRQYLSIVGVCLSQLAVSK
jgi:hypothetical protein